MNPDAFVSSLYQMMLDAGEIKETPAQSRERLIRGPHRGRRRDNAARIAQNLAAQRGELVRPIDKFAADTGSPGAALDFAKGLVAGAAGLPGDVAQMMADAQYGARGMRAPQLPFTSTDLARRMGANTERPVTQAGMIGAPDPGDIARKGAGGLLGAVVAGKRLPDVTPPARWQKLDPDTRYALMQAWEARNVDEVDYIPVMRELEERMFDLEAEGLTGANKAAYDEVFSVYKDLEAMSDIMIQQRRTAAAAPSDESMREALAQLTDKGDSQ